MELFANCPKLFFIDDTSPVHLYTDASDYGIGAHLIQIVDGEERSIAFISQAFDERMQNWDVPQKEGYAIYYALDKWDYLLRDRTFTVHTDHVNLIKLKTDYQKDKKVQRWLRCFQGYDYRIVPIKGQDNIIADAFSRLCVIEETAEEELSIETAVQNIPWISRRKHGILRQHHNEIVGHMGVERTLSLLIENGHEWPNIREDVKNFIKNCPCCQKNDQKRSKSDLSETFHSFFRRSYATDLYRSHRRSETDNKHIVVMVDSFSRYLFMFPIKEKTTYAVAKAILNAIGEFGAPKEIVSDRGPCFVGEILSQLLCLVGTEHKLTMAYSKEENGMVERANKEILRHLRNIIFDKDVLTQWSTYLPLVRRIFNSSLNSITGVAPSKVIFGNSINLNRNILNTSSTEETPQVYMDGWIQSLIDGQNLIFRLVQENLHKQRTRHLTEREGHSFTEFEIGSYVLVEHVHSNLRRGPRSKLLPFLKGPLKVIAVNGDVYTLRNLLTRQDKEYHVRRLHKYLYDPMTISPLKVACKDDGSQYQLEYIEKMRGRLDGKKQDLQFLVHWVGYETPTWEPWKNVHKTFALYYFLKSNLKYQKLIPKNIKYLDSDEEVESDSEDGEPNDEA